MRYNVTNDNNEVVVTGDYNQGWIAEAKKLGGKWDASRKAWVLASAVQDEVFDRLSTAYGYDLRSGATADDNTEIVTVRVTREIREWTGEIEVANVTLARAFGRDSGAKLGNNCALIAGPKPTSGGSVKNWQTVLRVGATIKIHSLSAGLAEAIRAEVAERDDLEIV